MYGYYIMAKKTIGVKRKRGSGIKRPNLERLTSREIENNKTIFKIMDEH